MARITSAFLLLMTFLASGQTHYYVNGTSGNNNNNGLSATTAWKTIQKALNAATPNSIVYIKGGTYHEGLVANVSGTASARITFTNYSGETVIVDGTSGVSGSALLSVTNRSYLTFENMTLQHFHGPDAKGIRVNTWANGSCNGLVFKNMTISDIGWTDDPSAMPGWDDNALGIYICGEVGPIGNITIDGCEVRNIISGYSEAVSVYGQVSNYAIKNCVVHDNTNIGIHISGTNDDGYSPTSGTVSGNTCYTNVSPVALSAGIYTDGSHDVLVERNKCYDNPIGIEVGSEGDETSTNIVVKNNLIYNNRNTGLSVGGYDTSTDGQVVGCTFRNNTLYKNNSIANGGAELTISKASNCVFEDNIFYSGSQNVLMAILSITPQSGNIINYNGWYTAAGNANNLTIYVKQATYHTFSQFRSATSYESNGMFANPNFPVLALPQPVLVLPTGNPCINAGNPQLSVASGETDYDGSPRVIENVVDLGAREFATALAAPQWEQPTAGVSPNPVTSRTRIRFGKTVAGGTLTVYDVSGKMIRQLSGIAGDEADVDFSDIASGLYLFSVTDASGAACTGKFVRQ